MWWMYGLEGNVKASERVPIRLAFNGDAVRAAVAAGIKTIAVNTGPLDPQLLLDEGASWLFPSMQALADNLDSILPNDESH